LLASPACSGGHIDTVWDTQFDFAGLNTFDWAVKEPETGAALPYGTLDTAIKAVVDSHMRAVGFRRSSNNPSFLLTYYVGDEEVARLQESYYGRRGFRKATMGGGGAVTGAGAGMVLLASTFRSTTRARLPSTCYLPIPPSV